MQVRFQAIQLRRGQQTCAPGGARWTHLGIPDARSIEEREQVQKRQPRDCARVHLAHQSALVDAGHVYVGVEHRLLVWRWRGACRIWAVFDVRDVFLVGETL